MIDSSCQYKLYTPVIAIILLHVLSSNGYNSTISNEDFNFSRKICELLLLPEKLVSWIDEIAGLVKICRV